MAGLLAAPCDVASFRLCSLEGAWTPERPLRRSIACLLLSGQKIRASCSVVRAQIQRSILATRLLSLAGGASQERQVNSGGQEKSCVMDSVTVHCLKFYQVRFQEVRLRIGTDGGANAPARLAGQSAMVTGL